MHCHRNPRNGEIQLTALGLLGFFNPFLTGLGIVEAAISNLTEALMAGNTAFASYSDYSSLGDRANKLHMMELEVLLQYAQETGTGHNHTDWHSIGVDLWHAFFNDDVARAADFKEAGDGGQAAPAGKMGRAIAYSVLEGAQGLVFGNTGARALFDDADQLGGLKTAGKLTSHLSDELSDLAKIVMQFSGLMAKNKVNAANHTDLKPELGVLSVSSAGAAVAAGGYAAADTLFVDLSQARWTESDTGTAQPKVKIVGVRANEIIVGGAGNDNRLPERLAA